MQADNNYILFIFFYIFYLYFYIFFIFCRNSVNVEGATHKQVIDVIRSSGDTLSLTGIIDLSSH